MSKHPDIEKILSAARPKRGLLGVARRLGHPATFVHMSRCGVCREEYSTWTNVLRSADRLGVDLTPSSEELLDGFKTALRESGEDSTVVNRLTGRRTPPLPVQAAAIATVALAAILGLGAVTGTFSGNNTSAKTGATTSTSTSTTLSQETTGTTSSTTTTSGSTTVVSTTSTTTPPATTTTLPHVPTWSTTSVSGLPNTEHINYLACPSESVCLGSPQGPDPYLWRSTDFGTTWEQATLPAVMSIGQIGCVSATVCYVGVGVLATPDYGAIVETQDGGITWTYMNLPPGGVPIMPEITCVWGSQFCLGLGLASSQQMIQEIVEINGSSITLHSLSGSGLDTVGGLFCYSSTDCLAAGEDQNMKIPVVASSVDGGSTWTKVWSDVQVDGGLQGVACEGPNDCVAVGVKALPSRGTADSIAYISTDGGHSWKQVDEESGITAGEAVSCTVTICFADNLSLEGINTFDFSGEATSVIYTVPTQVELSPIACVPSGSECVAIGFTGGPTSQVTVTFK